jgi:hypothetical protein
MLITHKEDFKEHNQGVFTCPACGGFSSGNLVTESKVIISLVYIIPFACSKDLKIKCSSCGGLFSINSLSFEKTINHDVSRFIFKQSIILVSIAILIGSMLFIFMAIAGFRKVMEVFR